MDFGLPILRGPIDLHLVYSFHDLPRPLGHIRTRRQPLACTLDRKVQKPDSSPLYYKEYICNTSFSEQEEIMIVYILDVQIDILLSLELFKVNISYKRL